MDDTTVSEPRRRPRQAERQRAISEMVMAEGAVRIEQIAERFGTSLMTAHRDLDELEAQGLLHKSRGIASALSSSLVESSEIYRSGQQLAEKRSLAQAAMELIEPGQSIFLDDSTTVLQMAPLLTGKAPLTVITNVLTLLNELRGVRGVSLIALGGNYFGWCNAFMGRVTNETVRNLHADISIMSTAAIIDDTCYHQTPETTDTKRAMFESSSTRILLADHTKFQKRALHVLAHLSEYDAVIVDAQTRKADITRLRSQGIRVIVAPAQSHGASPPEGRDRGA